MTESSEDAAEPASEASTSRIGRGLRPRRRIQAIAFRAAVSLAALAILSKLTNSSELVRLFAGADARYLVGAAAVLSCVPVLTALRWMAACRVGGGALSYPAHLRMTYVSSFLGQALPTSLGVEAARVYFYARESGSIGLAVAGAVADRLSGAMALLLLTAASFPLHPLVIDDERGLAIARAMSALSACALAAGVALASPIGAKAARLLPFEPLRRLATRVHRAFARPAAAARLVAISLAIYAVTIAGLRLISEGLGADISLLQLAVLAPPSFAILLLPISIAGWGLRETGFVLFLGLAGVAREPSLALSVVFGATMLVVSAPGAPLYLASRRREAARSGGDGGRVES
jgi:uncharacterized membrane protein YbhN (UPF0104 family)